MRFTFAQVLTKLDDAKAFPADLDTAGKKAIFNEGLEAVILSGRWNGTEQPLLFTVPASGLLTLPPQYATVKAAKVNGYVRDMASPWYSYLQGTSDLSQFGTPILDRGDNFCTFAQLSEPARLRVTCVGETTSDFEVHGLDADGRDIYTNSDAQRGQLLTFNAVVSGSTYFTTITEISKPVTGKIAYLYAVYADASEELIGIYAPGETVPRYRAYLVQEAQSEDGDSTMSVSALCQLRHIDLVADNDICPIGNFRALKNAVRHIHWEREEDPKRSETALDTAIKFLNDELKMMRPPSEVGGVRVNARLTGACGLNSFR